MRAGRVEAVSASVETAKDCRGAHRWRVVGFSLRERTLTERCTACGRERVRGW